MILSLACFFSQLPFAFLLLIQLLTYCICTLHLAFYLLLCYYYHIPVTTCFCLSAVGQREQNFRNNSKIGIHRQVNICEVFNQNLRRCKSSKYSTVRASLNMNFSVEMDKISQGCLIKAN